MIPITATLQPPAALSESVLDAWRDLRGASPAFSSPLLSPEFTLAVGRVRPDAAVAVYRRSGRVVAVLPHHRRPDGVARPIGSVWSDYHALISEPGMAMTPADALPAAEIKTFHFKSLVDPFKAFSEVPSTPGEGHLISLKGRTGADYWESLRAESPKRFKNLRRLEHKLEREQGEVSLTADPDPEAYQALLSWKHAQFARTGAHDVLKAPWSAQLMRSFFETGSGPMRGLLITLRAAGRPIAAHFGVQLGGAFHPWLAAFDPALAPYSPGQVFMGRAIPEMTRLGLTDYDLSQGYEHYKRPFASEQVPVSSGVARAGPARGLALAVTQALERAGTVLGPTRTETLNRVRGRLDHIATAELSLTGRLQGLARAAAFGPRRSGAARPGKDKDAEA